MQKNWLTPEEFDSDQREQIKALIEELHCPRLVAEMLYRKQLRTPQQIRDFFEPQLSHQHDPFLFPDMEKAVQRILKAIDSSERITIYGDYDVDGTTATTLLYLGLKRLGAIIDFYIPHRMIDGYGLSLGGLDQIKDSGTSLIISVDCGVNALEEIEAINAQGMEIIITDHHNPKEELPPALAIINPKLPGCPYPFPHLAGVGVAYKLLMAIYRRRGIASEENTLKYMDLVAVGTIADIVPLTGENRVFAHIGLQHLIDKKNLGLNALVQISGLNAKSLDTTDIVFGIAPRINAAGRMGSASVAVDLLISRDRLQSKELAEIIERQNSLRQQEDQKTYHEACDIIDKKYKDLASVPCIVVSSDDWHPGVIGIVASKLVEKYDRPVVMISFKDGFGSGSGRSVADFDLFAALTSIEHNLHSFGGHKYAVGFTILQEYIDRFENELSRYVAEHLEPQQIATPLEIDYELELYDISEFLLNWVERFAPFGPDNNRPVLLTREVTVASYPYTVGRNHLKLKVIKDGVHLDLIGYNLGDMLPLLKKNSILDIAYTLEFNRFGNKTNIQGKLKDLRLKE
ncbi:MAG: single-stranded-DNA-specific exonuclease RecJ [Candidatus Cloacimonadaceae bacterium]|jgi:single-stranded-DNA-specific exonuclease|nr:single-stranded-DNA-specific exonuclease RecJ [Candidatus Cloacimonadota bacterium]MDX9949794.1 single-stranded-DNA-specific exonuclease RecJ [Candidatus Syntrophosphaera sp.]NLN85984.1 single-stranded-DNA-specific exonuclease RecJ [Candidatus Cloacimonadota bacterium]